MPEQSLNCMICFVFSISVDLSYYYPEVTALLYIERGYYTVARRYGLSSVIRYFGKRGSTNLTTTVIRIVQIQSNITSALVIGFGYVTPSVQ